MQSWLEWRNWIGKGAQATGLTTSLRILASKADSQWVELKLESEHQESPRSDIFRKRATKPLLIQKHRQKHLTWVKEKKLDCCSVDESHLFKWKYILHLIWKSRSQSLKEVWRGTESMLLEVQCEVSHGQWWFGMPCHLLVLVHLCWSPFGSEVQSQCTAIYQENVQHFMLPSADFIFQAGLCTCPHWQRYQKLVQWLWCYCAWLASKLAWPELHRESTGYCLEEDESHQTQQCRWPELHYQINLGFSYTWAVPQTECLHTTPHWCSNSCKRRPNQVLSA